MAIKNLLPTIALLCSTSALCDTPLAPPLPWKTCDPHINFCTQLDPKNGSTVYKIETPYAAKEIYKIPGWYRSARISEDGQYFVAAYGGLNLVPIDVKPTQVMLTVWKSGVKHKEVALGQLIKNWSSLQQTTSHYRWGSMSHLSKDSIHLTTVEGAVSVNMETGLVSFP